MNEFPPVGYLLVGEAARRLCRSAETVRHMAMRGELHAERTRDGFLLFREQEVDEKAKRIAEMEESLRKQRDENEPLTVEELGAATNLHPSAIIALWNHGNIPHCGLRGQRPVFRRERVRDVIEKRVEYLEWLQRQFAPNIG